MKILQVITSLRTAGAEKLVVDCIPLFQANGLEVDVLLLNGFKTPLFKRLKKDTKGKIFLSSKGGV